MGRHTRETAMAPCVRTQEPCNFVDDDGDGITDPSSKTMSCTSHADCTYGGAQIGDDCDWPAGGVCNTIHSPDPGKSNTLCAGVACPPLTVCVAGDCVEAGRGGPLSECDSGSDCALTAGCIPWKEYDSTAKRCIEFCHEYDCPAGFVCMHTEAKQGQFGRPDGDYCRVAPGCPAAESQCAAELIACFTTEECVIGITAVGQCILDKLEEEGEAAREPLSLPVGNEDDSGTRAGDLDACYRLLPPTPGLGEVVRCAEAACAGQFTSFEVF